MKTKIIIITLAVIASMTAATAQVVDQHGHAIDTTDIYGERADSLDAAVFTSSAQGNYISRFKDVRTEVISAAGLCKMACCNLAESFENSATGQEHTTVRTELKVHASPDVSRPASVCRHQTDRGDGSGGHLSRRLSIRQ